jgi:uncharacterized protein DUF6893
MSIVGEVTLAVIALIVLIGLVVGLRSIPDVRRYLKIRNM